MKNRVLKFSADLFLLVLCVPIAFWLRLESIRDCFGDILVYLVIGLPFKVFVIAFFGLSCRTWRNMGVRDLFIIIQAVGAVCIGLFSIIFVLQPVLALPRSVPIIEGCLSIVLLGGARLAVRLYFEGMAKASPDVVSSRVLIVGAGQAGTMIVREMNRHPGAGLVPVGFLDDDPGKRNQIIYDRPVLGRIEDLPRVVGEVEADEVVIAMPSVHGQVVRKVVDLARAAKVRYRTIPRMYDILLNTVSVSSIREVNLEDLLRRDPVQLKLDRISNYIEDRVVLVSGAGGSIGSEIVNQIIRFKPRLMVLLGRGENSLFITEKKVVSPWPRLRYKIVVADLRNRDKIFRVMNEYAPSAVFHAAAHKHVPLMEGNPDEAVLNNVGGTLNLVQASLESGVRNFVNISTDKAVRPTSVMGASKRVAEYVVKKAARDAEDGRVFVSVRFGNVLGSRGSVIPLFRDQIKRGGPVTVTHRDMKRYFMTIPEAAQLVLQAGGLEMNGSVFVLDMGDPVRIIDLAEDMIKYSGLEPYEDIDVVITGIRPGEKLFEEYMSSEEVSESTSYDKIFISGNSALPSLFDDLLEDLFEAARAMDGGKIKEILKEIVPTYIPFDRVEKGDRIAT